MAFKAKKKQQFVTLKLTIDKDVAEQIDMYRNFVNETQDEADYENDNLRLLGDMIESVMEDDKAFRKHVKEDTVRGYQVNQK